MEFMAKIPRLRDEYIKRHGIDPFIEKFTAVIAHHQSDAETKQLHYKNLKLRQNGSIFKHQVTNRQPEIMSQVGGSVSSELVIRNDLKIVHDRYSTKSPNRRSRNDELFVGSRPALDSIASPKRAPFRTVESVDTQ